MSKLKLTFACWDYDRTRALADGRVRPDGIELTYLNLPVEETFFRMMRYREFDVSAPEYQPMAYFSSDVDEDPAAWLSNIHGTYSTDEPEPAAEG